MKTWRLILNKPGEPSWNMAVDEYLLTHHGQSGDLRPILRLYSWLRPAVSLGHFQDADQLNNMSELEGLPVVKRISGGSAVLHGGDLTYSVIVRTGIDAPYEVRASYLYLCQGLIRGFALLGLKTELGTGVSDRKRPFDCFASIAPSDLQWQGQKVAGSAQCRRGDVILQHGSIPVKLLPEVGSVPGGHVHGTWNSGDLSIETVEHAMVEGFRKALKAEFQAEALSNEECRIIQEWRANKHDSRK